MVCLLCRTGRTEAAWPQEKPPARVRIVVAVWPDRIQPIETKCTVPLCGRERQFGQDSKRLIMALSRRFVVTQQPSDRGDEPGNEQCGRASSPGLEGRSIARPS